MRRETRTIAIMALLALGGVGALWFSAHRYVKIIGARGEIETEASTAPRVEPGPAMGRGVSAADRALEDFVLVRRAVHDVVRGLGEPSGQVDPRTARLLAVRDDALEEVGMARERYVLLRRAYRAWRAGREVADAELRRALDARRADLTALDLGVWEAYDR